MATKEKDKRGPSTQRTGTVGVNAIGVNHGMTRQEATPQQAMAQLSQTVAPQQPPQVNYAPGFTDVPGSPSYQQYGPQQVQQQAPVVAQPVQQQVTSQAAPAVQPQRVQQTPVDQQSVKPVAQQQFVLPPQITLPNGQVINTQQTVPVKLGSQTYQIQPPKAESSVRQQQQSQPTAAQQNAAYEAQKQQEAEKQQYNQLVDEYRKAGGNPKAILQHIDPNIERLQPTADQLREAQANAQKQAKTDDDEYVKTLKEYLDSKYESNEDKEAREKREARQRRFAAISEGLANVFNVGGAIAGAKPAEWKSGVGELYANQEAESDKRRLEYRQALKDMIDYRTAIRNGDIAQARAIEERRKNDFYERKMLEDIASKQANDELKKQKQEADERRKDQEAKNKQRAADDRHEEHVDKKARGYTTARSSSGGGKGRGRSGGSRATGAAAAKSAKAAAKRRAKAATQGTKFGKK